MSKFISYLLYVILLIGLLVTLVWISTYANEFDPLKDKCYDDCYNYNLSYYKYIHPNYSRYNTANARCWCKEANGLPKEIPV